MQMLKFINLAKCYNLRIVTILELLHFSKNGSETLLRTNKRTTAIICIDFIVNSKTNSRTDSNTILCIYLIGALIVHFFENLDSSDSLSFSSTSETDSNSSERRFTRTKFFKFFFLRILVK